MIAPDADDAAAQWTRCPECAELVSRRKLERTSFVCPKCGYHFRLTADQRLAILVDRGSFAEHDAGLGSRDVLDFPDDPPYEHRLTDVAARTGHREAVLTGTARIDGVTVAIGVFNFPFMGGSMGSAVGEKLTRVIEHALAERLPLVIVSASGGARMQEGIYSLMQMAKTSAALGRLAQAKLPFISVLTHPTMGGVTASFATLGDVIIAEPGALIGFAGARVIKDTTKQTLPSGFQTAEFLLKQGLIDQIVTRLEMRERLRDLLLALHVRKKNGAPAPTKT